MPAPPDLQRLAPPDHEDFSCWRPLDGLKLRVVVGVAVGDDRGDSPVVVVPAGASRGLGPVREGHV